MIKKTEVLSKHTIYNITTIFIPVRSEPTDQSSRSNLLLPSAYILQKLNDCSFFDNEVQFSMFYLTLHDAMLHVLDKHPDCTQRKPDYHKVEKTKLSS